MTRAQAIAKAQDYFDLGRMKTDLGRLIAIPTESQNPDRAPVLGEYLDKEMQPLLESLGFTCRILTHAKARGPFLYAERIEDPALPTILGYGHGDVIRGLDAQWSEGLSPWKLVERDGRWYGRGVVDNKGQHLININGLRAVLETRGKLGFNAKYLIEMGEESGSPGLRELCEDEAELLKADILIASDGPRLNAERPTVFLGARGVITFDLQITAREGGHHSGNWAASSPTRRSSSPMPSPRSPRPPARSAFMNGCRRNYPTACAARSPIARSTAARTARRSIRTGASRASPRPNRFSAGAPLTCWR